MKIAVIISILAATLFSCQPGNNPKTFEVSGTFSNTVSKKIFLAELPFGSTQRIIVDTASIDAKGNFTLQTISKGEGMYQVFIENGPGLMLISDAKKIELNADGKNIAAYTTPGNKVNEDLKKMFGNFIQNDSIFRVRKTVLDSLQKTKVKDSVLQVATLATEQSLAGLRKILNDFINTQANGTAVYFTVGMAKKINSEAEWNILLQMAIKRFPNHPGLKLLQVNNSTQNSMEKQGQQLIGKPVPDISLPDTSGKPVTVSSFKGKWVLIDFWASWCAPCRTENPNVLAAFNRYKNKNFTVLGISLDLQKAAWLKAINQDQLAWTQISDLKQWQGTAPETYGINGIPFNILVDPAGIVVAVNLRSQALLETLAAQLDK